MKKILLGGGLLLFLLSCPNPLRDAVDSISRGALYPRIALSQGGGNVAQGATVPFGSTVAGTPINLTFTIANNGGGDLILSGNPPVAVANSNPDDVAFTVTVSPTSPIQTGGTQSFVIELSSGSIGTKTATVSIASNDPDNPTFSFTASAEVTAVPQPSMNVKDPAGNNILSGGTYAFPQTIVGQTADAVFTLENIGLADLLLSGTPDFVQLSGTDAASFSVTVQPASPVSPSTSRQFTIRFAPTSIGTKSATVTIPSNDPTSPQYSFTLSGPINLVPIMQVGNLDASGTFVFPPSVSFLTNSGEQEFTITNTGNADLVLTGTPNVTISGSSMFTISLQPALSTISKNGGFTKFTLHYNFTSITQPAADVSIPYNGGTYIFHLSAKVDDWHGNKQLLPSNIGYWSSIAVDGSNVYIAYYDNNADGKTSVGIKLIKSTDNGVSFGTPITATSDTIPYGTSHYRPLALALYNSGTHVYLWVSYYGGTANHVKCAISIDGGAWTAYDLGSTGAYGTMNDIEYINSILYIVYTDNSSATRTLYCAYPDSYSSPTSWTRKTVDSSTTNTYYQPAIAGSGSNIYISYCDSLGLELATWDGNVSDPCTITIADSAVAGKLDTYSSIALSGTNALISYYNPSFSGSPAICYTKYNGSPFTTPIAINSSPNTGNIYSSIVSSGSSVLIAYSALEGTNVRLHFRKTVDGSSWQSEQSVDSSNVGSYPSLAKSGSNLYISYYCMASAPTLRLAKSIDGGTVW